MGYTVACWARNELLHRKMLIRDEMKRLDQLWENE